jgi:hypothetical protein
MDVYFFIVIKEIDISKIQGGRIKNQKSFSRIKVITLQNYL